MPVETFRTRHQLPLQILLGFNTVLSVFGIVSHFAIEPKSALGLATNAIGVVLGIPLLLLTHHIALNVTESELVIRTGLLRQRVAIGSMRRVRTVDAMGDSITSFKKRSIKIAYGSSDSIVVAPVERDAFVAALVARNPAIVID